MNLSLPSARQHGSNVHLTEYIYDATGNALGFIRGRYIYNLRGMAIGHTEGSHVYRISGPYAGELFQQMIVDMHLCEIANTRKLGNPHKSELPRRPDRRSPVDLSYLDVCHRLF